MQTVPGKARRVLCGRLLRRRSPHRIKANETNDPHRGSQANDQTCFFKNIQTCQITTVRLCHTVKTSFEAGQ